MRASAILDRIRAITRPGSQLLLLGADTPLLEAVLADGFNAFLVVNDRRPFLRRAFAARVFEGTAQRVPLPGDRFGTAVTHSSWFDGLRDEQRTAAVAEVSRVASDALVLITAPDAAPAGWSRREWWESQLFDAGWRRHTRFFAGHDFESLEDEAEACLLMQRLPAAAVEAHPLSALRAERNLHMDMLRETGRRSDAHLARYEWARSWVKPGDIVVDSACGLGYGAAILWDGSDAATVIGLDISDSAIRYATDCFADGRPGLSYRVTDAESWDGFPDNSVDCIVSFETIEHLERPDLFVQGARRVLKPGGRFLCSIPNEWLDETGRDPNPFHLHVFNLDRLIELIAPCLLVDEAYAQSAGGHAERFAPRRTLRNAGWPDTDTAVSAGAEWWLLSAVKDPIGVSNVAYEERVFPSRTPVPNALAFGRDYVNPWAVHALVMGPFRVRSRRLLRELAARWLATSPADSADAGAALCVLAYRDFEAGRDLDNLLAAQLDAYRRLASDNPQVKRWQISLAFVEGLWRMRGGDLINAESCLRWCANADASSFTPHLETKTTEAAWWAGRLASSRGDSAQAGADWRLALAALDRLRSASIDDWLLTPERPAAFEVGDGLREVALAVDSAVLAANGLRQLNDPAGQWRPGARPVARNLQRTVSELVDVIDSRGGDIVLLRAQTHSLYWAGKATEQALAAKERELELLRQHHAPAGIPPDLVRETAPDAPTTAH